MDYGQPKVPPAVGGGILIGASLAEQLWLVLGVLVLVGLIAILIRLFWRKHKGL